MSIPSKPYFHNEEAAFEHVAAVLWPDGPTCPHCGACDRIGKFQASPEKRVRMGLHKCGRCKKQLTVRVGTAFEASKIPPTKWLQTLYLTISSRKGISARRLHPMLEVQYKTAWFVARRIREAMRSGDLAPFGTGGGHVEVDETFIGSDKAKMPHGRYKKPRNARPDPAQEHRR